ncbi:hypothetical protein PVAP13_2NG259306 [Panicum virgatum]|uniref:Uncharacterized protein n=1 Tax=Panicum virgatum TaxID=38727 RepID=A0A8T0VDN7_PANVG|nr:hypothetical protein PVAP13_2NG259306 [Panicum virgatum]
MEDRHPRALATSPNSGVPADFPPPLTTADPSPELRPLGIRLLTDARRAPPPPPRRQQANPTPQERTLVSHSPLRSRSCWIPTPPSLRLPHWRSVRSPSAVSVAAPAAASS